ncbi:hypothetical protein [Rheinheimera sp. 4Y26]|uniref:hypothetical protein n=1 Tax=Rheinheimera sp. 4Y26 TaxID=2977811 RepID=UPI0021B14B68|nr:hypothetical protein [Rheinheimera sp. 4Y26]MCT6701223.1 hypothetical protein [Rheinheimera sp. 4Y26]
MKFCFGWQIAAIGCGLASVATQGAALATSLFTTEVLATEVLTTALPEAEPVASMIVPPVLATRYQSADAVGLLAFSPDNQTLAFSTNRNSKQQSELGDIWLSELYAWSFTASDSPQKLIDASTTNKFAYYGAPALRLQWQHNNILLVIGNGDDEATELTYLTAQKRLKNPNIGEWTLDEPPSLTDAELQVQQCFADWRPEVVEHSNNHWLQPGKTLLYQASYAQEPGDLWLIDLPNCQRTLLPLPKGLATAQIRAMGGALYHDQLVLVLQQIRHQRSQTLLLQTLLLQTNISTLGTAQQQWLNWSYGLGGPLEFTALTSTDRQSLFLLTDNNQPCRSRLYSLNQRQLSAIAVDGHRLCNATVSDSGLLGLTLTTMKSDKKAGNTAGAKHIWVVQPAFLQAFK